ncbi:glycosyltransferase family 4 protein [bacterium]|nr:glycosyltransferase family 4 protein [bacterium]
MLLTADPGIPVPPKLYGGIERIVADLAKGLVERGWEVGLVASQGSRVEGVKHFPWAVDRPCGPGCHVANAITLYQTWRKFRPHVVHSFSRLIYLWRILWSGGNAVMSYQRMTGGWNLKLAQVFGGKRLGFTALSEHIAAQGRRQGGKWHVVPNFVDTEKYKFVREVPADAPLVFLSRVDSDKGPDLAIRIARKAGEKLILAGNKPELEHEVRYWKEKVEPEIGNGVEYIGPVDDRQKNELLGKAAALLVPVQWEEPFGIVFAEALACGTPVISCPRGALPEIVKDGVDGFLIRNEIEGVEAVRKISQIRRESCRKKAEEKYSISAVVPQYERIYRELERG